MERCCDVFALEDAMLTGDSSDRMHPNQQHRDRDRSRDRSRRRGIAGSVFACDSAICDLDRLTNADE